MSIIEQEDGVYLTAHHSSGSVVVPDAQGFCTLAAGTYYFVAEIAGALLFSLHCVWDGALAGVLSLADSNRKQAILEPVDTTPGRWITENLSTAYLPMDPVSGAATVSNMTLTILGSAPGGCMYNLGNIGSAVVRAKIVVSTGGKFSVAFSAKD